MRGWLLMEPSKGVRVSAAASAYLAIILYRFVLQPTSQGSINSAADITSKNIFTQTKLYFYIMTMPFTDHHIQDKIIAALVVGGQRFSDLVPEGMEHSLFMYHMRKLTKQGLVEKEGQAYRLTLKGAQLYNARHHLDKPLNYPRALIQFLVVQDDQVLLSRRTTGLADQLNEYMLPGGMHYFLAPSRTAAGSIARARGLQLGSYLGCLETIAPDRNYHGLIDLYEATCVRDITKSQAEHELVWLPLTEVVAMSFDRAGSAPHIAQRLMDGDIQPRMTWVVSDA